MENFKYLGRILDRYDNNWPGVIRNFGKVLRVWRRLGKMIQREGAEPKVSAMFY